MTSRSFSVAATALILLALALRIAGAHGDLWQDEITSLALANAAHSVLGVFLLAYDNNHYLNTAWLHLVGPDASPLVMRAFSIVLGVATVTAAGLIFAKDRAAALLAMALFAVSFPMVTYGSEARGYAGLVLCTLLAIHAVERERKYLLAAAIGFGLLFHLSMAASVAALGLAALLHNWQLAKSPVAAIKKTAALFLPSLGAALPVALIIVQGIRYSNGYHFGYLLPFERNHFVTGFGGMMNAMAGLSDQASLLLGFAIAILAIALTLCWRNPQSIRPIIYLCFLLVLPVAVVVFQVPNSGIRRYYLGSATVFLLCAVDLAREAWQRKYQVVVALTLMIFFAAQTADLAKFMQLGRGQYSQIVRLMTSNGPASFGAVEEPWPARVQFTHYAKRLGLSLAYVAAKDSCTIVPEWVAIEEPLMERHQPPQVTWGQGACTHEYGNAQIFQGWGMSGGEMTLYRRLD